MKYHFPSSSNPLWWSSLLGVASFRSSTTVARSFADTIAHGTDKVYEQRKNAKRIHLQTRRHNALSSTIISFQTTPGKEPDPKDILHFKVRSYLLVLIYVYVCVYFLFYSTFTHLNSLSTNDRHATAIPFSDLASSLIRRGELSVSLAVLREKREVLERPSVLSFGSAYVLDW